MPKSFIEEVELDVVIRNFEVLYTAPRRPLMLKLKHVAVLALENLRVHAAV